MEHRHTEQFGGISATFETNGFWEVASLLHTFRKESTLFEDLVASLEPDDAFYDIGANFGTFSCFAGKVVSSGEVYAFEPHPDNVERTRRNLDLNDLEAQVLQCALSDESDESELAVDSGPAGDQRHSLSTDDAAQTIGVATEPGDKLISERALSPPSVLKIDVEGAEYQVVDGLSEILSADTCRLVYCEVHPELIESYRGSVNAVRTAIEGYGFDLETLGMSGGQIYLRGSK